MQIRINKYLSQCNVGSRRTIEQNLWNREFTVNEKTAIPGQMIDDEKDIVKCKGKILKPDDKYVYIALNKPKGYVSTLKDERGRETIMELLHDEYAQYRLYPVGRLDKDSTGLILITNDGNLALKLTHPRYHLPKVYEVTVDQNIKDWQITKMEKGVEIGSIKTLPTKIKLIDQKSFQITLKQGIKRQIREMCKVVGLNVVSLNRISIGTLKLGSLKIGQSRLLTQNEIHNLKSELM